MRVAVNGLIFAAVNGEIGLAIAVQIQFAQRDTALDWLLEDSGSHASPVKSLRGEAHVFTERASSVTGPHLSVSSGGDSSGSIAGYSGK